MTASILGLILTGAAALFTIFITVSAFRTADRLAPEAVLDGTGQSGIDRPLSSPRAGAMRKLAVTSVIFALCSFGFAMLPERDLAVFNTWFSISVTAAAFLFLFLLGCVFASKFGPAGQPNHGVRGFVFFTALLEAAAVILAFVASNS